MNPPLANQPFLEGNGYSSWSLALRPDFSSVCVYVAFTSKMFEFPPSTKTSPMTFCLDKTPHISSHARSETPCGSAQKLARSNLGGGDHFCGHSHSPRHSQSYSVLFIYWTFRKMLVLHILPISLSPFAAWIWVKEIFSHPNWRKSITFPSPRIPCHQHCQGSF